MNRQYRQSDRSIFPSRDTFFSGLVAEFPCVPNRLAFYGAIVTLLQDRFGLKVLPAE